MSDTVNDTIQKKRKIIWLIWFLPVIALLISSWMIFKHLNEQAEEITVYFDSADGFVVDKTPLKYRGIKIGTVSDIDVNRKNINEFIVTIEVSKKVNDIIAKEGTKFWKVEPKATLTEISGLKTIFSGVYIDLIPPSNTIEEISKTKNQTIFKAEKEKPIDLLLNDGVFLTLTSSKGNLSTGAPVLYKSFIVGKILKKSLKDETIFYTIFIENQYRNLIKNDTNFWSMSGIEVEASLSGVKLHIDSLATLIAGGISFDSKEGSKSLKDNGKFFKLYNSKEDTVFNNKTVILTLSSSKYLYNGITQIFYNGFDVGKVIETKFLPHENKTKFFINLKKDYTFLLKYDPYFNIVKPELNLEKLEGITGILKGKFIELSKNSKKKSAIKYKFTLYDKPKKQSRYTIVVETDESIKVSKGSPVYFKDIKVGEVSYKKLNNKTSTVRMGLNILWKYRYLINDTSIFYLESPIEINADLSGINIKTAPLKSYISSALSFDTIDLKEKSTRKQFKLFNSYNRMLEEKYFKAKGKRFIIEANEFTSINKNDFIYYNGIEVGKVVGSTYNDKTQKINFEIFIFDKFTKLINSSTNFYSISGIEIDLSLDEVKIKSKSLDAIIRGALSFTTLDKNAKVVNEYHKFDFFNNIEDAKQIYTYADIYMSRGFNLKRGSKVKYKDIEIGKVKQINFNSEDTVVAKVAILKSHKKLLNEDTIFYLNDFKFNLSEIKNPKAAIFGPDINVLAGKSTVKKNKFELLTNKPLEKFNKNGLRVIVNAKNRSSIKRNTPIYYRQIQIGVVEKFTLSDDSTTVKLQLFIDNKYEYLVRENSIFYNAGGFGVDLYLFGVKIKTETVETLINGGISMLTPTKYGDKAKNMKEYILHSDLEDEWLDWNPMIRNLK